MAYAYKSVNTELGATTDGTVEVIYQCPSATTAVVLLCQVANIDGTNTANVNVTYYDSSQTSNKYLAYTINVPADAAINPIGGKLVLEAGDQLRAWANATGDLDIVLSVVEIS